MNYKFTRPGEWVEFAQDEPFCRIVPLSLALVEDIQGRIRLLSDEPRLHELYHKWSQSRDAFNRQLHNPFSEDRRRGWQKDYFQGQGADGQRQEGHQTKLNHREFIDERADGAASERSRNRPKGRQRLSAQATLADAYDFLWRDSRPFESRCRKSVQVLSAIAQTIDRAGSLDGNEQAFLASYRRFHEASSEAFTQVLLEPRAYFWIRICFQLVDTVTNGRDLSPLALGYCRALGAANARQALPLHLSRFAEFELAANLIDGRDWSGQIARAAAEPWSIPASRWTIESSADIEVRALAKGELSGLEHQQPWRLALKSPMVDHKPDTPRLSECPVLDSDCSIRLQPAALAGLGVTAAQSAIDAGDDYQARHANLIQGALEAIGRYAPEVFEQIRDHVRIIGLKPARPGEYSNVSVSQLPGAMLLTVIEHPLVMADRIIHEFHHHRLFSIEDGDPLLEPDAGGQRLARYYSPWRDDLRPTRGILHGLYVFIAVGRFWLAVHKAADRPADQPYVFDQLLRIGKQLSLAQDVLASHARFTPIGEGAFEQLTADVAALHEGMRQAGLPDDTPALLVTDTGEFQPQRSPATGKPLTVAEAIEEHLARFEG